MNELCKKSQELVNEHQAKLQALEATLTEQRSTLANLQSTAREFFPEYTKGEKASDLPPEFQKELQDTLHQIDAITQQLSRKNSTTQTRKIKNLV